MPIIKKEGGHSCPGPNCDANLPGNIEYCPHCGTSQTFSTVPDLKPVTIPPSEETSQTFIPNRRARVSTFGSQQSSKDKGIEKSLLKLMKNGQSKQDFPDLGQTVPYKASYERVVDNIHTDPVDDAEDQYHGELNYDPPEEYGGKGTQGIPRLPWMGRDEHPDPAEDPDKLFTQMMPLDATPEERKAHAIAHGRVRQYEDFGNEFPYERYPASRALRNSVLKLMKDESVSDWHRRNRTIRHFSPDRRGMKDPDEGTTHPFNAQRGGATHSGLRRPRGKLGMTDKIDPETGKSTGKIDYRTGYHSPDPTLFTPGQEVTTWPKHQGSSESARKRRGMENAVLKLMKQGTEDGSVPYGRMYGPQKFEPQAPDHDSANWPQDVADQQGYYPQDPLSWDAEWKNPEQESIGHESGAWMFPPEMQQYMEELQAKKEPIDFLGRTAEERFQQGGQRYNDGTMSPANYHDLPYEYLAGGAKSRSESETAAGETHDDGNWLDEANTIKVRNPNWITNTIENSLLKLMKQGEEDEFKIPKPIQPSDKSPQMDQDLTDVFGVDRKQSIKSGACTMCKGEADKFKDDLSRKEYGISGMCQNCQDKVWGGGEDYEGAIEKSLLRLMKARSRMHSDGRYYVTGHEGDPQYEVDEDWLHYNPDDPEYGWENWRDAEVPEGTDPDYEQEDLHREEQIGNLDREIKRDTSRDPAHRPGGFWDQRLAEQEQYNQNALLRILSRGINPETGKLHPSHNVPLNELPYAERDYNWTPISPEDHKEYVKYNYPTEDRQNKLFPLSSIEEQAGFKPGLVQRTYNRGLDMRAFGPNILTGEAQKLGEADPPEFHQNSIEKALLKLMKADPPKRLIEHLTSMSHDDIANLPVPSIQALTQALGQDARQGVTTGNKSGWERHIQRLQQIRAAHLPPPINETNIENALLKLMKQGEEEPQQQTSEKLQQTEVPFYGHSAKLLEELKRYQQRMQEEGNKNPKTLGDK